jgi:CRISPR-associated protein Csd1
MMQRFADHPNSTWRTIELSLQPYMQRLQSSRGGFLHNMREMIDKVFGMFQREEFQSERPLSGEFLLGYHCQRLEWNKDKDNSPEKEGDA